MLNSNFGVKPVCVLKHSLHPGMSTCVSEVPRMRRRDYVTPFSVRLRNDFFFLIIHAFIPPTFQKNPMNCWLIERSKLCMRARVFGVILNT